MKPVSLACYLLACKILARILHFCGFSSEVFGDVSAGFSGFLVSWKHETDKLSWSFLKINVDTRTFSTGFTCETLRPCWILVSFFHPGLIEETLPVPQSPGGGNVLNEQPPSLFWSESRSCTCRKNILRSIVASWGWWGDSSLLMRLLSLFSFTFFKMCFKLSISSALHKHHVKGRLVVVMVIHNLCSFLPSLWLDFEEPPPRTPLSSGSAGL